MAADGQDGNGLRQVAVHTPNLKTVQAKLRFQVVSARLQTNPLSIAVNCFRLALTKMLKIMLYMGYVGYH